MMGSELASLRRCAKWVAVFAGFIVTVFLSVAPATFVTLPQAFGAPGGSMHAMQQMPASNAKSTSSGSAGGGLSLAVAPAQGTGHQLMLTATVPLAAMNTKRVSFFVVTTELGGHRLVPLGSALTDSSGTASVMYQPTWAGKEEFVAEIGRDLTKPLATASKYYVVATAVAGVPPANTNAPKPLRQVGKDFVAVVLAVVAAVWMTLLITLYRVVVGTRKLSTRAT
ncbi:MAG: hypothetical protein M0008_07010 [Actinomycetota bacterium]|nr:hypothetical protein [Actinomycetota bacterium]